MQIVVNHITRMRAPRICVAGVDLETSAHVRPTTRANEPITRRSLREEGGPFSLGAVVDIGPVTHQPAAPETEDHRFESHQARHVRDLCDADFLEFLDKVRASSLEDGFGRALQRVTSWKYAVEPGAGTHSLAVVRAERQPLLDVNRYERLQLRFDDPDPPTYLAVTDIRFFEADHKTLRAHAVDDVARRLRRGVDAYLMLGLARTHQVENDDRERHWLQLNGLVLADRPTGNDP